MQLSALTLYPVKSLAGVEVETAALDRFGLAGDRRWLVVDGESRFLTQRELSAMATISALPLPDGLRLSREGKAIDVALPRPAAEQRVVTVWADAVAALDAGATAANWLSEQLQTPCRLVYMPADTRRGVDTAYARAGETVSFADGFPLLLVSRASLDDLNGRLQQPVPMNRFRPNLVVDGCEAFAEDGWRRIRIGALEFEVAKPCSRCVMPSIDQATGARDAEILRVLAGYRRGPDRQTYFGQNLLYRETGTLRIGDAVEVLARA